MWIYSKQNNAFFNLDTVTQIYVTKNDKSFKIHIEFTSDDKSTETLVEGDIKDLSLILHYLSTALNTLNVKGL
jgi:hypothetical protein